MGPGHVCTTKMLSYLGEDDDESVGPHVEPTADDTLMVEDLSHLRSLDGTAKSKPFRVLGTVDDTTVSVLIDTSSSHDFVHPRIAERLRLALTPIRPFRVYVGNGASLFCSHVARHTKISLQGAAFEMDLHVLEIHGPDIILGMTWLESLGKISADFVNKTLEFTHDSQPVIIHGVQPSPRAVSLRSLALIAAFSPAHEFYELIPLSSDTPTMTLLQTPADAIEFSPDTPAPILAVLNKYQKVFSLPTGMPPRREFDHRIHLLPNTKPINVRPYRYPYF